MGVSLIFTDITIPHENRNPIGLKETNAISPPRPYLAFLGAREQAQKFKFFFRDSLRFTTKVSVGHRDNRARLCLPNVESERHYNGC